MAAGGEIAGVIRGMVAVVAGGLTGVGVRASGEGLTMIGARIEDPGGRIAGRGCVDGTEIGAWIAVEIVAATAVAIAREDEATGRVRRRRGLA